MLDKVQRQMAPEEFYAWQERQPERYELVDGLPVLRCPEIEMMTGASRRHDRIVTNVLRELGNQLRGRACSPFSADTLVVTGFGSRRRPDAGVECGPLEGDRFEALDPRLVVEVLSPSTRDFDLFNKVEEYKATESLAYILLIEPNAPQAYLWSRGEDGAWRDRLVDGLETAVELPQLGVTLLLADLYEGLPFPPRPRLFPEGGS